MSVSRGLPIVLSAPSGAGKTTIAEQILREWPLAVRSISCTTRPARSGEQHGRDYFFLSDQEFQSKLDQGEFVESAVVHGRSYGTPKRELESNLDQGKDVLLVIDPQGAVTIRQRYPEALFIFVIPPTWDNLVERLTTRATDKPDEREKRLTNAQWELSFLPHYDYLVVNELLEVAVADVLAIIRAEHRKLNRVNKQDIPILSDLAHRL